VTRGHHGNVDELGNNLETIALKGGLSMASTGAVSRFPGGLDFRQAVVFSLVAAGATVACYSWLELAHSL
jgi:hypothetical protein